MDKPPQPWDPYTKDCSLGYCSYYCPQFCSFLLPSPPPPTPPSSQPLLSPLLIAIITVTCTAFVLLAYYLLLARYRRARLNRSSAASSPPENRWTPSAPAEGIDDYLISKIALCRYRRGGGLVADGTDCSVCLSPFEDGDGIRLLPKCGHVFHQSCIDTWLKSHCSCPLCRAGIFPIPAAAGIINVIEDQNRESEPDTTGRVGASHEVIIEIGDRRGVVGRSFSMDSSFRRQTDTDTDTDTNSSRWSKTLHSVLNPVRMKRSRSMRNNIVGRGMGELLCT